MAPTVEIQSNKQRYAYGETILLDVSVINTDANPVYIAYERVSADRTAQGNLLVTLGQSAPEDEYEYYEYDPPRIRRLGASWFLARWFGWNRWADRIQFGMPPLATVFDSGGNADWSEIDVNGQIEVKLQIGYGDTPFRVDETTPARLKRYLDWQQDAKSNAIQVFVEPPSPGP